MPIPDAQFDTWSHIGAIPGSKATYATVKAALEAPGTAYAARNFRVFLQGSYGNDTNIYAESDVDVVILLEELFHHDWSRLPAHLQLALQAGFVAAPYQLPEFKRDVTNALVARFGTDVSIGSKAIAIAASGARRKADVIVAAIFRRHFLDMAGTPRYFEGICFRDAAGNIVENFPELHGANLTAKHQRTGSHYKPLVRVFKNVRSRLVSDGLLPATTYAPSYFLEGLAYNVPDAIISGSRREAFVNAFDWLAGTANRPALKCANEVHILLGDGTPLSWPPSQLQAFLDGTVWLWKNWT